MLPIALPTKRYVQKKSITLTQFNVVILQFLKVHLKEESGCNYKDVKFTRAYCWEILQVLLSAFYLYIKMKHNAHIK